MNIVLVFCLGCILGAILWRITYKIRRGNGEEEE